MQGRPLTLYARQTWLQPNRPDKSTLPDHSDRAAKDRAKAKQNVADKASRAMQGFAATLSQHVHLPGGGVVRKGGIFRGRWELGWPWSSPLATPKAN